MMDKANFGFPDAFRLALALGVVAIGLLLVMHLSSVFLLFFAAMIFAIALELPIERMRKNKIPRGVAVTILYASALAAISILLYLLVPPIAHEIRNIASVYPTYLQVFFGQGPGHDLDISPFLSSLADALSGNSGQIVATVSKIFGGLASFVTIFFLAFFLNLQRDGAAKSLIQFIPANHRERAHTFLDKVESRVGGWLWGKTLASLAVGVLTLIGLWIIGVPYAVLLAVLAMFLNYIPYAGAWISAIPAVALGFLASPVQGIAVIGLYLIINTVLEGFVFGPLLMKKAIDMNPAIMILAVIVGGSLGGIPGIIISIPIAAIVQLAIQESTFSKP